jgi:hypothetical protein
MTTAALHCATHRLGEAAIDLHDRKDDPWISRTKNHAGSRHRNGAVRIVKDPVAENTVAIDIIRYGEIDALIEIIQPLGRLPHDRSRQKSEDDAGKSQALGGGGMPLLPIADAGTSHGTHPSTAITEH